MISKGISFDNIHSFYDLNLILSGVEITPAKPKTNYVDIVGGDGSIDMTEAHGDVKFYDRDCKFTFSMHPSGDLTDEGFEEKKTEVSNCLSGRACKIILDKDNGYYYQGRCTVDEFLSDKRIRKIVVTAKVKPYKFRVAETVLSFALSATEKTVVINNSRKSVVPMITASKNNARIVFGNASYSLEAGTHQVLGIEFKQGANNLTLSGSGTLEFRFREADL